MGYSSFAKRFERSSRLFKGTLTAPAANYDQIDATRQSLNQLRGTLFLESKDFMVPNGGAHSLPGGGGERHYLLKVN